MYCEYCKTKHEAVKECLCLCKNSSLDTTYYHCNYGNCCGYKCEQCGKFKAICGNGSYLKEADIASRF